jgi:hypothetical protein
MDMVVTIAVKAANDGDVDAHTVATISDQQLVLKVLSLLLESTA